MASPHRWFDDAHVSSGAAATLSVCLHFAVIALAVVRTLPPAGMPPSGLSNRAFYIPPPEKPHVESGPRESVHYVSLNPGTGAGARPVSADANTGIRFSRPSPIAGERTTDSTSTPAPVEPAAGDSVYSTIEVDTAVVRSPSSTSPVYPAELLVKHIEGVVVARFVVDTTGVPDVSSFEVMRTTDEQFASALLHALPGMKFSPAKIGARKVRQLVEQSFAFRIAAPTPPPKPPPPAVGAVSILH